MNYHNPLNSIIQDIEKWADVQFSSITLPHAILDVAIWHVLTASEDISRLLFTRNIERTLRDIDTFIDRLKYSLKLSLQQINSKSKITTSFPTPQRTIPSSYEKAHLLINAGFDYHNMVIIFTNIHKGHVNPIIEEDVIKLRYKDGYDLRYAALELLDHGKAPDFDITSFVFHELSGGRKNLVIKETIARQISIKNGRVKYKYAPEGVHYLVGSLSQRDIIIPNEFKFNWGSGYETHALINSLLARCIYHILSINCAVEKFNTPGGFDSSLVIQIKKDSLIEDLRMLADFPTECISGFIDALTYGNETKTPDPALQPLIKLKNGDFLIPCFHIISSNVQRNILTLTARSNQPLFDRQSNLFEIMMCDDLWISSNKWPKKEKNKIFSCRNIKEEFDFIVIDEQTKSILALEARWMLQPGDTREIQMRVDACDTKVSQLSRKLRFLSKNLHYILCNYFSLSDTQDWKIYGTVVIDGFGGKISSTEEIPIITLDVLMLGLEKFSNIANLWEWIKSLDWLPQQSIHFQSDTEIISTPFMQISRPGFYLIDGKDNSYYDHINNSIGKFKA